MKSKCRVVVELTVIIVTALSIAGMLLYSCDHHMGTAHNHNRAFRQCMGKLADQRPVPQHWVAARECNRVVPKSGKGIHIVGEMGLWRAE